MFRKKSQTAPCKHMKRLLESQADGSLKGFARWYAMAHAARCGPCAQFLRSLEELLLRLKGAREEVDPETIARLDQLIPQLDRPTETG